MRPSRGPTRRPGNRSACEHRRRPGAASWSVCGRALACVARAQREREAERRSDCNWRCDMPRESRRQHTPWQAAIGLSIDRVRPSPWLVSTPGGSSCVVCFIGYGKPMMTSALDQLADGLGIPRRRAAEPFVVKPRVDVEDGSATFFLQRSSGNRRSSEDNRPQGIRWSVLWACCFDCFVHGYGELPWPRFLDRARDAFAETPRGFDVH